MELEELKLRWNELDNRLSTIETLNQKAIHEAMKAKTTSTLTKLQTKAWLGPIIGLFVVGIVMGTLTNDPEVKEILNPNSLLMMWIFFLAMLIYAFIEASMTSRINLCAPITQIMKRVATYKKAKTYSRLAFMPITVVLCALFIFFESGWIIERGRVLPVAIFFIVYCVITFYAYKKQKKEDETLLNDLESNLKELDELSK